VAQGDEQNPQAKEKHMSKYLIWSNEHQAWWGPNKFGYVSELGSAGLYDQDDALRVCADALRGWNGRGPMPELSVRSDDLLMVLDRLADKIHTRPAHETQHSS
jgi:hypothetical protein